jgi:hypothetical protein
MKQIVISFIAGTSGNFLRSFLADTWYDNPSWRQDFDVRDQLLPTSPRFQISEHHNKHTDYNNKSYIICTHICDIKELRKLFPTALVIKIHVLNNYYGFLKNLMFKKKLLESDFTNYYQDLVKFMHVCFWHLKNDDLINTFDLTRDNNTVEFDFAGLYDINQTKSLYLAIHGDELPEQGYKFHREYINSQFPKIPNCTEPEANNLDYIYQQVTVDHKDKLCQIFDLMTIVYFFERNNKLLNHVRTWDFSNMPTSSVDDSINFLRTVLNAKNYFLI